MHPDDRRYHKEHTWAKAQGNKARIGITDHAQEALGDIVFIELPEIELPVEAGVDISEIESTKATASVIVPVSGTILAVNEDLDDSPEIMNEDPYEKGWIAEIELSDPSELEDLMDSSDYERFVEEESD
ncbi:MAG: glycine cleavage system protein GcvH [Thermodesulfovibrionales bacterium]|nr:glycine cleavage system protein GcvH [Thermodesulfovibrionales bacterium]